MQIFRRKRWNSLTIVLLALCFVLSSVIFGQTYEAQFASEKYDYSFYEAPDSLDPLPLVSSRRLGIFPRKVKNVIYFVGDGMSYTQIAATRYQILGADKKLHFETMPVTGNVYTHSADNLVTDSAAASTALATGYKTDSGKIAMNPDEEKLKSIMIAAQKQGKSSGLVVTSAVTHATPASFAAHVPSRAQQTEIAADYFQYGVDVLFGGGLNFFLPDSVGQGVRKDGRNLLSEFQEAGYQVAFSRDEMKALDSSKALGLFSREGLTGSKEEPTLAQMTEKAIELLSQNPKGFFMHVEGSQIDWAAHGHDYERLYYETLHFDMAVKKALDFARKDGNTLVIVTADHETGGLTILYTPHNAEKLNLSWSTGGHSAAPVPVYAYGPHAEKFTGTMHLKDLPVIIAEILNIDDFPKVLE